MMVQSHILIQENEFGIACYHCGQLLGEAVRTPVTDRLIAYYPEGDTERTTEESWLASCLAALNIEKREAKPYAKRWRDEANRNYQRWLDGEAEEKFADVCVPILIDNELFEVAA